MGHKHKTWSAAMSVGRSVLVDVLHKIDNADKVTDNRFKFNKNFLSFYRKYEHFFLIVLSQFVTILIDVDFTPFRGKVNEACPFGYRCTRFWTPDLTFGQKKGENTSLNFQCVVLTNPFFYIYLFF